jgi:SAM-dependent methyltransferase
MVSNDALFVKRQLEEGLIRSPCLELGVGYGGETIRDLIESSGLRYFGTDVVGGLAVDIRADFESPTAQLRDAFSSVGSFGSVIALNVLEHTFDPIHVLDNITEVLQPGGTAVVVAPAVWPLHSYPKDFWRINPDFYVEYCVRRRLTLVIERCQYIGRERLLDLRDDDGHFRLPTPSPSACRSLVSRSVHKIFNTFGRGMSFPSYVGLGVVIEKTA